MPDNHNIQILYNTASKYYDIGTPEEFAKTLEDPENVQIAFDTFSKKLDLGTYDDFEKVLGLKKKDISISSGTESPSRSTMPEGMYDTENKDTSIGMGSTAPVFVPQVPPIPVQGEIKKGLLAPKQEPESPESSNIEMQNKVLGKDIPKNLVETAQITEDPSQLHNEAFALLKNKKNSAAGAVADIILQKHPGDSYAHEIKAHNLELNQDYVCALKELTSAIEKRPEDNSLYARRATLANKAGFSSTAKEDAKNYIRNESLPNGDEDKALTRANMHAIIGDKEKSEFWIKNYEGLVFDRQYGNTAETLKKLPDWLWSQLESVAQPLTIPPKMLALGVEKIGEGVLSGSLPKIASGVIDAGFGILMANPAGVVFNSAITAGELIGAGELTEYAFAPVSKLLQSAGIDEKQVGAILKAGLGNYLPIGGVSENTIHDAGELAVQVGNLLPFMAFSHIVHGAKSGEMSEQTKESIGETAGRLTRREPMNENDIKNIDETLASAAIDPEITKGAIDMASKFIQGQKDAKEVSEVQKSVGGVSTYRIGSKLYPTPDAFLKRLIALKEKGIKNVDFEVNLDDATSSRAVDLFKDPIVSPESTLGIKEPKQAEAVPERSKDVPKTENIRDAENQAATLNLGEENKAAALKSEGGADGENQRNSPINTNEGTSKNFVDKPIREIKLDEKRFQNREKLDQEQVERIKKNWNKNELDPVVLWLDPGDGETYLIAGFHREHVARLLGEQTIISRYFEGTEAEAIKYAKEKSNANRTMEQPYDRAKIYRKMREDGVSGKEIRKALEVEGKNRVYVENLGFLNPTGRVMTMLKSLGAAGDKQTVRITEQVADWIGDTRRFFPELTDSHETELYDWLVNKHALDKIKTKAEFNQRIGRVADAVRMNPNEPLNLEHKATFGELETEKNSQITTVTNDIKALEKERKGEKTAVTEKRLTEIADEIELKTKELGRLKRELITARDGDKAQIDIFSQINDAINKGEISDDRATEIIRTKDVGKLKTAVEDIESKAGSGLVSEVELAIKSADEIIFGDDLTESTAKKEISSSLDETKQMPVNEKTGKSLKTDDKINQKRKEIQDILEKWKSDRANENRPEQMGVGINKTDEKMILDVAGKYLEIGVLEAKKLAESVYKDIKDFMEITQDEIEKIITGSSLEFKRDSEMVNMSNAIHDAKIAGKLGVDALMAVKSSVKKTGVGDHIDSASQKLKDMSGPMRDKMRSDIKKRGGTPKEQAMLIIDYAMLEKEENSAMDRLKNATDEAGRSDAIKELSDVRNSIMDNAMANSAIGNYWHELGQVRQAFIDSQFSLADMIRRHQKINGLSELTDAQRKHIEQQYSEIRDLKKQIEDIKEEDRLRREEVDGKQYEEHEYDRIIKNAQKKRSSDKQSNEIRQRKIRAKIDESKNRLRQLHYGQASSLGALNPEIYIEYAKIAARKAEEFYVETKGKIEFNQLVKETLREIHEIHENATEKDVRDAISGNYNRSRNKTTKTELESIKKILKKEAFAYEALLKEKDRATNKANIQNKYWMDKLRRAKAGEHSVKKNQPQQRTVIQRIKENTQKESVKSGISERDWNRRKLKETYEKIQKTDEDLSNFKKFHTHPLKTKSVSSKFNKSDKLKKAEHLLAVKKFQFERELQMDLDKNKPWSHKFATDILRWQRFSVLSYPTTLGKLAAVVAYSHVVRPMKFITQDVVNMLTPSGAKSATWGKVNAEAVADFYTAFIKNFTLDNLNQHFIKGSDKAEMMFGEKGIYEEWTPGSAFLEMPGRSHGYIKSFIKTPEIAFSIKQQAVFNAKKMAEMSAELQKTGLSDVEKDAIRDKYAQYDMTNDEVVERINRLAVEHGKWMILMNKNKATDFFNKATRGYNFAAVALKTEAPIVRVPTNYIDRYLTSKYGVVLWLTGKEGHPGVLRAIYKGTENLSMEQKEWLSRVATQGSIGMTMFALGYLNYENIKHQEDGSYTIFGVNIPSTFLHLPELESIFSGANTRSNISKITKHGKSAGPEQWLYETIKTDADIIKKSPFTQMLEYGAIGQVINWLYGGKNVKELPIKKIISKKITDIAVPGFIKEIAKREDTKDGSFEWGLSKDNMWQRVPKDWVEQLEEPVPVLRKNVKHKKNYKLPKHGGSERKTF